MITENIYHNDAVRLSREINNRIRIEEFLQEMGIALTNAGAGKLRCRCPLHAEKEPSFTVYLETNSFYCYGCRLSGTTIQFVKHYNNWTWFESVKYLADKLGLSIDVSNATVAERMYENYLKNNVFNCDFPEKYNENEINSQLSCIGNKIIRKFADSLSVLNTVERAFKLMDKVMISGNKYMIRKIKEELIPSLSLYEKTVMDTKEQIETLLSEN